jgi:hypothetical protein
MTTPSACDPPVFAEVDVLVVGGGPAGICAGLAAARAGHETLLVEQANCLGGIATAGDHGHISTNAAWYGRQRVVGGIAWEIQGRVEAAGFGVRTNYGSWFEVEGLKLVLEEMAREAGLRLLYYTQFAGALVEDGVVTGALIQNKSGRQLVRARRIIDCTGDGDVAASAGAPFEVGRAGDEKCQPMTLMFHVGGIDFARICAFRQGDPGLKNTWAAAQAAGDMEPFQSQIMGFEATPTRPGFMHCNFTHITGVSATSAEDLTAATMEGRRQAFSMIPVFRKYVPGMEECFLVTTGAVVGTRESRRITGEVTLTENDMAERRTWPDSIGYGAFYFDLHNLDGPGMDRDTSYPPEDFRYQIPYRILVPRACENLLVAGRCVSVTHIALGSIRVMSQCMLTGEAAGTAAAQSLDEGVGLREITIARLQATLRGGGGILDESDITAANEP